MYTVYFIVHIMKVNGHQNGWLKYLFLC